MWLALLLIIALTVLSIYGAFIGAERAQQFFNRPPLVVYWTALAILLIVGIAAFRRLLRVPGLLLMHAGCVLILAGGMWSSQGGHNLQKKLFGIDKIRNGQITIYEGHSEKKTILPSGDQQYLFSVKGELEKDLNNRTFSENLRQEFEKKQLSLSQNVTVLLIPEGNAWLIADNSSRYLVTKENSTLNIYDTIKELPFSVKLKDFRIEYYQPVYLYVLTSEGGQLKIPVELGKEFPLGEGAGTIKILKSFENFKIGMEDGKSVPFDDPSPGYNPALEVQITEPGGEPATQYVFEKFPGHSHGQQQFTLRYHRVISDYISELQIVKGDKVLAEKDIEVNHPLHYGGYHFYQSSYDDKAMQYTVLQVVSDTGLYVVYAGYWMLCLGVIWHMWLRHIFSRFKAKSK
jgi:hypothetical protein